MFCGRCGAPIPLNASFCPRCGGSVLGIQTPAPSPAIPISTSPLAKSRWGVLGLVSAVVYLIVVLVCFASFWERREADWASAVGYEIGSAFIPAAIVLLYYKVRKQRASAVRVIAVLASWVLITNVFSISSIKPDLTEADIPVIAKEAAGLVPITNPNDAGRTVLRDYFKEIIAQNKNYSSKIDSINYEGLYTPQSYLDAGEAKRIISQLDAALEIELSQEDALDSIVERCRTRINSLNWSEEYKKKFLKGFDEAVQKKLAVRRPLVDSEKKWLNSVRDIYIFVLDNQQYFRRSGDDITIANTRIRDEFNERIGHANELNQKYQASKSLYEQNENEGLSKIGLSAHDFGTTK
jgi:hypothetical protein